MLSNVLLSWTLSQIFFPLALFAGLSVFRRSRVSLMTTLVATVILNLLLLFLI
jgi:hypothetical protein